MAKLHSSWQLHHSPTL